jgi:superfamily I DNA/RNA helicase
VLTFNKDLAHNLQQKLNTPAVEVVNFHRKCTEIIGPKWKSPTQVEHWLEKNAAREIADAGLTVDFVAKEIGWRKDVGLLDNNAYLTANRRGRGTSLPVSKRTVINTIFTRYQQIQRASFQANRSMLGADWEDVPHFAAGELSTADHPMKAAYDVIMLDEAQDFAPSWMTVIKLMLKPEGTLFICDDPTQSIFRYFSWAEKGINVVGRTRVLRIPFRNTRSIAYAAHALIEADPNLSNAEDIIRPNVDSADVPDGVAPALLKCRDLTEEVRLTEAQIRQHLSMGVPAGEIAVLIHNKRLIRHWAHLRNQGCYVETFDKMKGLEFRVVFVPHLQTVFEAGSMPTDTEFISTVRRRIFTAMTRAREWLYLSYQGQCPAALDPLTPYVQASLDG